MRARLLFAGILLTMTPAATPAQDAPYPVSKQLNDLYAAEWESTLREAPTFASHLGDLRYNDRWTDVSLAAIERRHKHQEDVLARLKAVDPSKLPPADRLNYLLVSASDGNGPRRSIPSAAG